MSKARGSYRVDPLGHKKKSPVLLNGLTEAETNATASVMGLVEQKVLKHAPCLGMNCGITRTDQMHSAECQAEHAATIAGGKFVKPAQRTWVGLTEDDLVDVVPESNTPMSLGEAFVKYGRAIEAKLKKKNT